MKILTAAYGKEGLELARLSWPTIKAYARRCGAQFIGYEGKEGDDWTNLHKLWMISAHLDDRLIWFDSDIIVSPDCPNLFSYVPPGRLGLYNEAPIWGPARRDELLADIASVRQKEQMPAVPATAYYNAGVQVVPAGLRDLYRPPQHIDPHYLYEQGLLNARIQDAGTPVFELPYEFNFMEYPLYPHRPGTVWISHFACGRGQVRLQHMQQVLHSMWNGQPKITARILTCPRRERYLQQTLASIRASDWGEEPLVVSDVDAVEKKGLKIVDVRERIVAVIREVLFRSLNEDDDMLLLLEDDVAFHPKIRERLENWRPLKNVTLGSLYNPNVGGSQHNPAERFFVADPDCIYGGQAFLISRPCREYIWDHWEEEIGMPDIKMSRLAARMGMPIYYHMPSLVQHVGRDSAWGGHFHDAPDFDPNS